MFKCSLEISKATAGSPWLQQGVHQCSHHMHGSVGLPASLWHLKSLIMVLVSCTNVLELTKQNIVIYDIYIISQLLHCFGVICKVRVSTVAQYFSCHGSDECTHFHIPLSFCIFPFYKLWRGTKLLRFTINTTNKQKVTQDIDHLLLLLLFLIQSLQT